MDREKKYEYDEGPLSLSEILLIPFDNMRCAKNSNIFMHTEAGGDPSAYANSLYIMCECCHGIYPRTVRIDVINAVTMAHLRICRECLKLYRVCDIFGEFSNLYEYSGITLNQEEYDDLLFKYLSSPVIVYPPQ
jgi:hypothetical protein